MPSSSSTKVPSEVAFRTSRSSRCWLENRLDSYSPKQRNSKCHSKSRQAKSTKLRTEIRMDRKSDSEVAPTSLRLGIAAAMKEPTKSPRSKSLNRLKRTYRRFVITLGLYK